MTEQRNMRAGWALALLGIFIFSTNSPLGRVIIADAGMHPLTLLIWRFGLGSLLFGLLFLLTPIGRATGDQKRLETKIVLICLASGLVNGVTVASWFTALKTVDASLSSVLGISLFPLWTLLILALGGEAITRKKIARLLIVFVGLYFLVGVNYEGISWVGVGYIVIGTIAYALHLVSVQWYMGDYNKWAVTGLIMIGSAVLVGVFWLFSGRPTFVPGWRGWFVIIYQATILNFVGRTAIYAAIDRIGSAQMALATPVETVLTIIWSVVFLAERFTPIQWFGAGLILVSALMAVEFRRQKLVTAN